ncbi:MAG: hypothetical protein JWM93_1431 [Frankiales bacterium]|nr:hypothetical protein [Frankiales bacterium]
MVRFTGTVSEANGTGGRWVECPFDAKEVFGEARPRVAGTVNGHAYASRLASYGGKTYLGLLKSLRQTAAIADGSVVDVDIERDTAPQTIEMPDELTAALAAAGDTRAVFERLAFTHRKEYAVWVASAKQPATRARRAAEAVEMLRAGTRLS